MKTSVTILLSCISVLIFSQVQAQEHKAKEDTKIKEVWKTFLKTVRESDTLAFRNLSDDTIHCYDCLENTKEEYQQINLLRETNPDWYEVLYTNLVFIPTDTFIKEDFPLIFTTDFVHLLGERETSFTYREIEGRSAYEVLVTTTLPTAHHEGGQHWFRFEYIKETYKLTMISTIP